MKAATGEVGLDHHHALDHAGLRLVSLDKLSRLGSPTHWELAQPCTAAFKNSLGELAILQRRNGMQAMAQHSDGMRVRINRLPVGDAVTAGRESADHTPTVFGEAAGELSREMLSVLRRLPRSNDGDRLCRCG